MATTESVVDGIVADGGSTGLRPGVDCLPNPCDVCQRSPRWYGDLAFLLVWIKDGRNPTPLVTAGTAANFFGAQVLAEIHREFQAQP